MTDLFFYGTLRHLPLLELVLGRSADALGAQPASLPDFTVREARGQPFPMICPEPGETAQGVLVRDLSHTDLDRLNFYEGAFEYDLSARDLQLTDGTWTQAQIFFPEPGVWTAGAPWSLTRWEKQWGDLTLAAADEVMGYFGRVDAARIARHFAAIRTRAWALLAARSRNAGPARDLSHDVIVRQHTRAYIDYFGMEEIEVQHRLHDGAMSPVLHRTALMQGSAVVILPYDPVRDSVLLIEQFRPPVFLIDDPAPWVWEPVAGMIDPGETPEQAAHREAMEEAGIALTRLDYAGGAYSSTGSSTEFVHLYVALCDLSSPVENGGVATEGEDIRCAVLPYADFIDRVDRHGYKNLQLLALAHWLARHRERLRR